MMQDVIGRKPKKLAHGEQTQTRMRYLTTIQIGFCPIVQRCHQVVRDGVEPFGNVVAVGNIVGAGKHTIGRTRQSRQVGGFYVGKTT